MTRSRSRRSSRSSSTACRCWATRSCIPSIADISIPFVSSYKTIWTTLGIVSGWSLILLGLSYYARRYVGAVRWRKLHRFTALAWLAGLVHALGEGTDAGQVWFLAMIALVAIPALALLATRLARSGGGADRRTAGARASDLEEPALGPDVDHGRGPDRRLPAPARMNVAADGEHRALALDRRQDRLAAEMATVRPRRGTPSGVSATTRIAPSGQLSSFAAASSSLRSKLHGNGVGGTAPPSPKNCAPAISLASPWSTWALGHEAHACHSSMSVSALPGTSTAGTAIALSASIVLSSPLCIVAKSPAPITTSASCAIVHQALGAPAVAVQVAEREQLHRRSEPYGRRMAVADRMPGARPPRPLHA